MRITLETHSQQYFHIIRNAYCIISLQKRVKRSLNVSLYVTNVKLLNLYLRYH
jgi:hypothetical protein